MSIRTRTSALFGSALVAFVILSAGLGASNAFGIIYRDHSGRTVGQPDAPLTPATPTVRHSGGPRESGPEEDHHMLSTTFGSALGVVVVVLLVALTVFLIVYWLRHRPAARRPQPEEPETADVIEDYDELALAESVRRSAASTLNALTAGELSAADAIIECWRRMAAAAADQGIGRRATDTSTDLTGRVLARTGVRPETVETLAQLYRRAMFGAWEPGPGDVERATACLRAVVAELGGAADA